MTPEETCCTVLGTCDERTSHVPFLFCDDLHGDDMSDQWIKWRLRLTRTPEFARLTRAMADSLTGGCTEECGLHGEADRATIAAGLVAHALLDLWCNAYEAANDDGLIEGMAPEDLWRWHPFLPRLAPTLVAVGWLVVDDDGLTLPEFGAWLGTVRDRRQKEAERMRAYRAKKRDSEQRTPVRSRDVLGKIESKNKNKSAPTPPVAAAQQQEGQGPGPAEAGPGPTDPRFPLADIRDRVGFDKATGCFTGITEADRAAIAEKYPDVDLAPALRRYEAWWIQNPTRTGRRRKPWLTIEPMLRQDDEKARNGGGGGRPASRAEEAERSLREAEALDLPPEDPELVARLARHEADKKHRESLRR